MVGHTDFHRGHLVYLLGVTRRWLGPQLADFVGWLEASFRNGSQGTPETANPIVTSLLVDGGDRRRHRGGRLPALIMISAFFLMASFEDCGYMARVAVDDRFSKDRPFRTSVIPMIIEQPALDTRCNGNQNN